LRKFRTHKNKFLNPFDYQKEEKMKAKRITVVFVLAIVVILVSAVPASARAIRIEYTSSDCTVVPWGPPERVWISDDGVLHQRGVQVTNSVTSSNDYIAGDMTLVMDFDIDLATGLGHAYGTLTIYPRAYNGTWVGHWSTHISPEGLNGSATGQGTGDLEGMKIFNNMSNSDPNDPCTNEWGSILIP
jgi:hypothetical protein